MHKMDLSALNDHMVKLLHLAQDMMNEAHSIQNLATRIVQSAAHASMQDPFVMALTVFTLACFIGYYVVWKVTPALHSPLMAVTNAISSVIIVGAIMAMGKDASLLTLSLGFVAIFIASINIFGGFVVTQRMLQMFSKKK